MQIWDERAVQPAPLPLQKDDVREVKSVACQGFKRYTERSARSENSHPDCAAGTKAVSQRSDGAGPHEQFTVDQGRD